MSKQTVAALFLIVIGVFLFLDQVDIMYFSTFDYFLYGSIITGIFLFINGVGRKNNKGIFGGTFFLSYGIVLLLMKSRVFVHDDEFGLATLFLCLALANFVFFLFQRARWNNVAFGLIFGLIGGGFLLAHYNYYPTWYIFDQIERYWPLALIMLGVAILIKAFKRKEILHMGNH